MSKNGSASDRGEANAGEVPLRGSREASLGADGLRISRAEGTTPARAPDDSRPPAYGGYDGEEEGDAEKRYASREAALGGPSPATPAAGGLAPEDEQLPRGARPGDPDPERNWAEDEGDSES